MLALGCAAAWLTTLGGAWLHADEDALGTRLVAEWELPGPLTVVWPEHASGHRARVADYTQWIRSLPADLPVALVSPRPPSAEVLANLGRDIRYLPVHTLRDIQLRDWAGLPAALPNGRLFSAQFNYAPGHLTGRSARHADDSRRAGHILGDLLYGDTATIPLTASGAVLTHNGQGLAIASNRLISENEHLSIQSIHDILHRQVGITRLLFVPVVPDDEAGRVDHLVRFIAPDVLVVAQPPRRDEPGRAFADAVLEQLQTELEPDVQVLALPQSNTSVLGGVYGNYLHLLRVGDRILLPGYGTKTDADVMEILSTALPEVDIVLLPFHELQSPVPLNRLAVWF